MHRRLTSRAIFFASLLTQALLARTATVRVPRAPTSSIRLYPNTTEATSTVPTCSPPCFTGEPGEQYWFRWPGVIFEEQVLATVILEVDTKSNTTFTTTKYGTLTQAESNTTTGYVTDATSFWNSLMKTSGVVVENNTPVITLKPTIYTAPGEYITITTAVTSPTVYSNIGFLAYSVTNEFEGYYTNDDTGLVKANCTTASPSTIGLVPTITPAGFTNPYYAPLDWAGWSALIPQTWSNCSPAPGVSGTSVIEVVSALTTTETRYGDYVHSQVSVVTSKNQGTAVAGATAGVSNDQDAQTKAITPARPSAASVSATKVPERPATSQDQLDTRPAPSEAPKELAPGAIRPSNNPQPDSSDAGGTSLNSGAAPTAAPPELVVISGTTIRPGASPVTIGGVTYSLAASSPVLVVDGSTSNLPPQGTSPPVISGVTVAPGAAPVTIGGTVYSLSPSTLVLLVDGSTSALPQQATPVPVVISGTTLRPGAPALTISGVVYSLAAGSPEPTAAPVVIAGTTLVPGAPAVTISGTVYSLVPGYAELVVDGSTSTLTPEPTAAPVVIAGTTLVPGAPAVTISGTVYSLAPGYSELVVDGSTSTLTPEPTVAPIVISGTTLVPGAPAVTISGTVYSLAPDYSELVIDGSTSTLGPEPTAAPVVIAGTTLTPGAPAVTISGTTYSLGLSSSLLVVDGSTLIPETTLSVTSGESYGSLIWSGIGGRVTASIASTGPAGATRTGPQVAVFTGTGSRIEHAVGKSWMVLGIVFASYILLA